MNIKLGINWTKSAIAWSLLCAVFSFGVMAQDNSDEPLDEESAAELVEELANGLPDLIEENGGDELGCFKSTYFGLFGYGLFGKQADNAPSIDQKSLDLVNRWKEERLAKFQCLNADCSEVKIKP